ncbi:G3E family GTPase [Halohasta litchfieldiae]|jgi:G3E family GTPase|uniref:GTPase, G3E family n=1 Tax=Halohasta litchfieldiae TaxID=1073996 RepID=A0A1H6VBN4_9EURY|nr:GTP-binding protein [Halohasta litchfieldiae]ATW87603.1 G3E family GTPase [Halohasta litchfieldiae]SEI97692.1 GTPase, G3E family [Halohasta litchfieldiae]
MSGSIPVTILSGSLGAGKTTLVNQLLSTAGDRDLAVLVNDMGEVNVDADLVAEGSELDLDDGVTELSNGCICCELQDDLETAVVRLAQDRSFDHLIVESSGISEPAPVARLFTTESRVAALYDVDALVTVLDTRRFLDCFSGDSAPQRQGSDEDRPLSDLLVEQIEVSNIVLLNKADQCTESELAEAKSLVGALQPDAETIRTEFSAVDLDRLLGVDRFEETAVADLPGWKRALDAANGDHDHHDHHHHPDEVYNVSSFTYRRRHPFDPERFADVLQNLPPEIVRAKGTVWLAGCETRITMSQAGPSIRATAQGPWIASLPEVDRKMYRSNRPDLEWDDEHGDRRSELVFIGTEYDEEALRDALTEALATGESEQSVDDLFPTEAGEETVIRHY